MPTGHIMASPRVGNAIHDLPPPAAAFTAAMSPSVSGGGMLLSMTLPALPPVPAPNASISWSQGTAQATLLKCASSAASEYFPTIEVRKLSAPLVPTSFGSNSPAPSASRAGQPGRSIRPGVGLTPSFDSANLIVPSGLLSLRVSGGP